MGRQRPHWVTDSMGAAWSWGASTLPEGTWQFTAAGGQASRPPPPQHCPCRAGCFSSASSCSEPVPAQGLPD